MERSLEKRKEKAGVAAAWRNAQKKPRMRRKRFPQVSVGKIVLKIFRSDRTSDCPFWDDSDCFLSDMMLREIRLSGVLSCFFGVYSERFKLLILSSLKPSSNSFDEQRYLGGGEGGSIDPVEYRERARGGSRGCIWFWKLGDIGSGEKGDDKPGNRWDAV